MLQKENLERLRRIEAFKRDEAEDRIRADDLRTQQLKRFRLNMLEQRKAFQRQNDMQRIEILKSIGEDQSHECVVTLTCLIARKYEEQPWQGSSKCNDEQYGMNVFLFFAA